MDKQWYIHTTEQQQQNELLLYTHNMDESRNIYVEVKEFKQTEEYTLYNSIYITF